MVMVPGILQTGPTMRDTGPLGISNEEPQVRLGIGRESEAITVAPAGTTAREEHGHSGDAGPSC